MPRLPTRDDLGGLPSARSGRVIADYDVSAAGRGLANAGASIESAGAAIGKIAGDGGGIGGVNQAQKFETNRRFLEFTSAQQQAYQDSLSTVDPGAFGFRERMQAQYRNAAKEFFKTIPEALKPEYDQKLFVEEDSLLSKARVFETDARTNFYNDEVNKGLVTIENNLFSNPGDFDKNLNKGLEFINSIPDESFSRIQKAELAQQWRTKAQLAALNGVTPQERIRLLGGDPDVPDVLPSAGRAQAVTRGISGDVRKVVSDAAAAYGVDPNALLTIAMIESGGNPNAKNPNSSAGGLFQFIDSTAKSYGLQNKFDPAQAADAAARLARDNSAALESALGRKPTTGELYLAHQQGIGGATELLSNPNAKAVDLVGADAVRLNGGTSDMTAGQFASLWLKKAGDTHVPDAVSGPQFDASRADPRFADLPYEEAQKAIRAARVELGDQREAAAANLKATQAQVYDNYRLRIAADDQTLTADDIMQDARLDAGNKATLLNSLDAAVNEGMSTRAFMAAYSSGQAVVNPFDNSEKKAADRGFERMAGAIAEPEAREAFASDFVKRTRYIPAAIQDSVRYGSLSKDPATMAATMETAATLSSDAPESFSSFDGAKSVQDKLDTYNAFRSLGYSREEAGQRVIDAVDPEKVRQRDAILKSDEVQKAVKNVDAGDVADIFDAWNSFEPDVGGVPTAEQVKVGVNTEAEAAIVADYRSMYEQAIADVGGDLKAGEALAKQRFQRNYGVSGLSPLGSSVVIKYPPEKVYPAMPDGSHDYIREQTVEALAGEGIAADKVFLQADAMTAEDVRSGRPPRYRIFYEQDGRLHQYFLPFYADPGAANAAFDAKQAEAIRDAEGRMIENRERAAKLEGRGSFRGGIQAEQPTGPAIPPEIKSVGKFAAEKAGAAAEAIGEGARELWEAIPSPVGRPRRTKGTGTGPRLPNRP